MWGYPPPPPPHAQLRPAPRGIEVSPLVRTEVRWVNNPNGEARPCYMDRGTVKCAAKCTIDFTVALGRELGPVTALLRFASVACTALSPQPFLLVGSDETQMGLAVGPAQRTIQP
eukprot:s6476_g5.t1